MTLPNKYYQMTSTVTNDAQLKMKLVQKDFPIPKPHEVVIRVEASPINPSDQGVMFGWSNMANAYHEGVGPKRVLTAPISDQGMRIMKARIDQNLPVGNEGAGTVVLTGDNPEAKALMGKTVAALSGSMYAEYCCIPAMTCLPLLNENDAKDGASSFVNPLTALSMVETMKLEGHQALVHTAAASNLGQMLNKICSADKVALVNIVRREEQAVILRDLGAKYICNSSSESFMSDLTDAIHETGATLAFDATGGGNLASQILIAMEGAAARTPGAYSIYGSIKHKQVYLYGGLDVSPSVLSRGYGMAWGVGGWLLPNFLAKIGMEAGNKLRMRVAKELKTTFRSNYTNEISLSDALESNNVAKYFAKKTGEKFLICPQL
jgi:NADPH:quinone reductase-like Zn-dependent oxidoreductase